jgi:malonate transporter and related proteins
MLTILNLALPFFALIFIGLFAARNFGHGEEGLRWLNTFVVWFALPSLIFLVIADAPFEKLVDWPFVTATSAVTFAMFLLMLALGRYVFGAPLTTAAIQSTSASYGNVGYMGLPLAVAFFGPAAAVPAALVFCFDCALQFIFTAFFATLGAPRDGEAHWGETALKIVKQVVGHPFIIATVLGGFASAFEFHPPGALGTVMEMLMRAAGPVALFALGVTVGLRKFAGIGRELPAIVAIKILLQPLLALLVVSQLPGLDPLWLHVAVMMAALPTASNAFVLASQYKAYVEGSSSAVIVTTVLSALTIPALVYVIDAGWLP